MKLISGILALLALAAAAAEPTVTLSRVPEGGLQPRALVDARGSVHLVYFKGDPKAGDLFYATAKAEASPHWSAPLAVNHTPGSAIALGTIRGAQIALGKDDSVHVAWNGSPSAPKGATGIPMFYTRLNAAGTSFAPERNLSTWAGGLDGGGTVAADRTGNVYVVWHALAGAKDETGRGVFLARSANNGDSFERERRIEPKPMGACGCCGLGALADADGRLFVQYRAAEDSSDRPIALLVSRNRGGSFELAGNDPWHVATCPMSSQALATGHGAVLRGWETNGQIFTSALPAGSVQWSPPDAAPGGKNGKHPTIAINADGAHLLVWASGTGWARGGSVEWQIYDRDGHPSGERGSQPGLAAWSMPAAFALPTGQFVILY